MGGLVGYEVVRQLQVHGAVLPRHLFISAIGFGRAPDSLTSLRCASDHQVLGELRALGATPAELLSCQDFADLVVRVIRADAEALASYEHPTVPAIQVSTSLYGAIDDDLVPLRRLRSWGAVIIPEPQLALFPGGHFFAFEDPTPVVADIARRLGVFGAGGECPATVRPGLRQEGAIR